jgi:hypothetical protein
MVGSSAFPNGHQSSGRRPVMRRYAVPSQSGINRDKLDCFVSPMYT